MKTTPICTLRWAEIMVDVYRVGIRGRAVRFGGALRSDRSVVAPAPEADYRGWVGSVRQVAEHFGIADRCLGIERGIEWAPEQEPDAECSACGWRFWSGEGHRTLALCADCSGRFQATARRTEDPNAAPSQAAPEPAQGPAPVDTLAALSALAGEAEGEGLTFPELHWFWAHPKAEARDEARETIVRLARHGKGRMRHYAERALDLYAENPDLDPDVRTIKDLVQRRGIGFVLSTARDSDLSGFNKWSFNGGK